MVPKANNSFRKHIHHPVRVVGLRKIIQERVYSPKASSKVNHASIAGGNSITFIPLDTLFFIVIIALFTNIFMVLE